MNFATWLCFARCRRCVCNNPHRHLGRRASARLDASAPHVSRIGLAGRYAWYQRRKSVHAQRSACWGGVQAPGSSCNMVPVVPSQLQPSAHMVDGASVLPLCSHAH